MCVTGRSQRERVFGSSRDWHGSCVAGRSRQGSFGGRSHREQGFGMVVFASVIDLSLRSFKGNMGANAILGVSMAVCKAGAAARKIPL